MVLGTHTAKRGDEIGCEPFKILWLPSMKPKAPAAAAGGGGGGSTMIVAIVVPIIAVLIIGLIVYYMCCRGQTEKIGQMNEL